MRAGIDIGQITYPENLPVSARREDIAKAIAENQVVIVAGETGSGKTTQLPKILLELGRGRAGQIGHTQPRRIAARAVAERITVELGTKLGETVGYQVRFTDESSHSTLVKVMTDGVLLAQIQRDPQLLAYDTLIIDEAHERSLNIDFILGYLTQLLPQRPDLKVIITSATIDSARFADHFSSPDAAPVPVIEVTGRTYPVEVRYRPVAEDDDQPSAICQAVDELCAEGPGDILVFCAGERDIRDAADALGDHLGAAVTDPRHPQGVEILPLYSRLSAAEQHRVFQPHAGRRIVLATNVAETSLTVPGIRYVVDPGTARISRYSKATKVQRLPIEAISQASANQRSGRCGRVADGIAIRLYAEEDYDARPEFTEPEILRTSLASVILQMVSVGVVRRPGDVADFPFVERPDTRSVRDGVAVLNELGALDANGRLTPVGRALAALPMDPRLARMIWAGNELRVTREVMIIAAALSIQDPRERPSEFRELSDQMHNRFADPASDLLTWLNLWEYLRKSQRDLSGSAFRRLCRNEYINYMRVREWQDVVAQLRSMSKDLGLTMTPPPHHADLEEDYRLVWDGDTIHRALLTGMLSQIGMQEATEVKAGSAASGKKIGKDQGRRKVNRNEYLGARGARFAIFPGSPLAKRAPAWIMAAELVETSRLWARGVARIQPEWVEQAAGHLVKYTHSEPHWSTKQGAAQCYEKALLYGVPIVAQRKVLFGKVSVAGARELFIRHALVDGEWTTHHKFFTENAAVRQAAADVEHRSRQRGLVADDEVIFEFYDERIPEDVISARHFDRWWKDARRRTPDLLSLTLDQLLPPEVTSGSSEDFPDTWEQGDIRLALTYQFQPGSAADGVTVHVPLAVLGRLVPDGFDWMVPGLLEEFVIATIRALPKPIRVQLVPAPDVGREVVAWLHSHQPAWADIVRAGDMADSFHTAFQAAVRAVRGVDIPAEAWTNVPGRLPPHLQVTFQVVDDRGVLLEASKNLGRLQRSLAPQIDASVQTSVRDALQQAMAEQNREGAARSESGAHGLEGSGGPGQLSLPDAAHTSAALHVQAPSGSPTHASAAQAHIAEVIRMLLEQLRLPDARVTSRWSAAQALTLGSSPYSSTSRLVEDLHVAAIRLLLPQAVAQVLPGSWDQLPPDSDAAAAVANADDLGAVARWLRDRLEDEVLQVAKHASAALTATRDLHKPLQRISSLALLQTVTEIRDHVAALISDGFIANTPPERLGSLVRYVRADVHRLEKAEQNPHRDQQLAWRVADVTAAWQRTLATETSSGPMPLARARELADVRWLLEEFRISLFAQQLGTSQPVSEKRIHAILKDW